MLAYKAWRESRSRFLISGLALIWFALVFVVLQPGRGGASYAPYVRRAIYESFIRELFIVFVVVLGPGGLLQERVRGTVGFTLALPVSRTRLVVTRAAIGVAEIVALALLPALVISTVSPPFGDFYPIADTLRFAVLWSGTGAVVFSTAFLLSIILAGEYSAPAAGFGVLFSYFAIINSPWLRHLRYLNVFEVMNLDGPLPWLRLLGMALVSVGSIAAGTYITHRQDF
jgi:ABC-2 type transport system permease protein